MTTREEIVENWLPRYTGVPLNEFGEYILLTNFDRYVNLFANGTARPCAAGTSRCRMRPPTTSRSSTSAWAAPPPPP
jgi:hypothetical protein